MVEKWAPVIDAECCAGCGYGGEACGSEEHCIAPCQDEAIRMAWAPVGCDPAVGRWRELA